MLFHLLGFTLVCWLLADFVSGFWHWLEDRYFDVQWPVIGHWIAKPNELHHAQPAAFLHQGYWSRNSTTIIPAAVALGAFLLITSFVTSFVVPPSGGAWSWSLLFLMVSQANEIHAWSHQRCSPLIRALQETGLLQSPTHHARHHRSPFEIKYCVMTDWLNPLLDYVGFWRLLERAIGRVLGIWPKVA